MGDMDDLIDYVIANCPQADESRLGMGGMSMGGVFTNYYCAVGKHHPSVAVNIAGVLGDEDVRIYGRFWGVETSIPETMLDVALLLIGAEDVATPIGDAVTLYNALKFNPIDKYVDLVFLDGLPHLLAREEIDLMVEDFETWLK